MDKKKKSNRNNLSPITQLILRVAGICVSYFLLIGFTYLPGVVRDLDYAVRELSEDYLSWTFPKYQIGTVSQNRSEEKDNMLTVGYISKGEVESYVKSQQSSGPYVALKFHTTQMRIRELLITPILILSLLFIFSPLAIYRRILALLIGLSILMGLLLVKMRAMVLFSITNKYQAEPIGGWLEWVPFFSSPGLVFLIVLIIWLAVMLPMADRKRLQGMFSFT